MRVSYSKYEREAGETIADRKVVYISGSADQVKLAKADSEDTVPPVGFSYHSANDADPILIVTNDTLDGFTGLVEGNEYFLSQSTAGAITNTKPTSGIVYSLGVALSSTKLDIHIQRLTLIPSSSIFGSEFEEWSSEGVSSTTSQTYIDKLSVTTASLPAGDYRIEFCCAISSDKASVAVASDFLVDDVSAYEINRALPAVGEYDARSCFVIKTLTSATHTLKIKFKTNAGVGGGANIKNARISIWRVG